jgi:predicted Zn finger-like uncharacterized protein
VNCHTCHYALWNVRARLCPECGTPFSIRSYSFTINSVQFKCPHCDQSYYGLKPENGHIVPEAFDCVRCSRHITLEEMVLLPTAGVQEQETIGDAHPMREPGRHGILRWLSTVAMSMFAPMKLISVTRPAGDTELALKFLSITLVIPSAVGVASIYGVTALLGGGRATDMIQASAAYLVGIMVVGLAVVIWIASMHGLLRVTGSQLGFDRTIQCAAFASGPMIVTGVPLVGVYLTPLALLWWMIAAAMMLTDGHRIGAARGLIAAVWLPACILSVCFILAAISIF